MTALMTPEPVRESRSPRHSPMLPRWAPAVVAAAALVVAAGLYITGAGAVRSVLAGWIVAFALPVWAAVVEGRRKAVDRLVTVLVTSAFGLALLPLASILWTVISKGAEVLGVDFFTFSMRNIVGEGGGIYHALIGTLLITAAAAFISVPIGLLTAIFLVEYGEGGRLARWITFLVDVMTGIPSIVAGLFAYALFVILVGPGVRMGIGGAVALSVLMIPVVVRSCEEMLKLVPTSFARRPTRWASPSGGPLKVVLPTALAGIITGSPSRWPASSARPRRCCSSPVCRTVEPQPVRRAHGDAPGVHLLSLVHPRACRPSRASTGPGGRRWSSCSSSCCLNLAARLVSYFFSPKGER